VIKRIIMKSINLPRLLKEIKEKFKNESAIIEIKVYGSRVNGNGTAESDLDMCFILKNRSKKMMEKIDNILYERGLQYDIIISPVYFFEKEIKEKIYEYSPFYNTAVKAGISL